MRSVDYQQKEPPVRAHNRKSGQAMIEYVIVAVTMLALVSACALLLYALRGQSGRVVELVSSEYP